ncbi:MAG: protein kinase [Desulfobacterales bacterium]|nr:protein kinase [Desulfobacterales bacterium]
MTGRIVTDTENFVAIDNGDFIEVAGKRYEVIGHAREMRFGIEDPKYWVKRVIDVETGERKIVKLAFFEAFDTTLSGVKIRCFRDPEKEGNILNLVKNHPHFMQGQVYRDIHGNNIRVLDVVRGQTFLSYIDTFKMSYDQYLEKILPGVLKQLIRVFEAIRFLHVHGYRHGDIRNDHIIKENETGNLVWIDFDYDFVAKENPFSLDIFGLGNILIYAIGKGFHTYYSIQNDPYTYKDLIDHIESTDFAILDQRRFINLRKLYPCIPATLNNILMHFSKGTDVYYEAVDEIIEDINRCLQAFY